MTFKVGDMVQIIAPPSNIWLYPGDAPYIGKIGTVTAFVPRVHPVAGQFWEVKLADGSLGDVAQLCLRLIPPDPGRQLVRWNQCDWKPSRNLEVV